MFLWAVLHTLTDQTRLGLQLKSNTFTSTSFYWSMQGLVWTLVYIILQLFVTFFHNSLNDAVAALPLRQVFTWSHVTADQYLKGGLVGVVNGL